MDSGRIWVAGIERGAFHDGPGIRATVFFAGCPLFCPWCCNPEARTRGRLFLRDQRRCVLCHACVKSCPVGALRETGGQIEYNPALCAGCGLCAEVCGAEAISFSGREMSAREILGEALRDRAYYLASGGGITLSGGEPFGQPDGALELLRLAKEAGLHTVVQTTACIDDSALLAALPWVDLFYVDLKHADEEKLARLTGESLAQYINNVSALRDDGARFVLRTPVVPGVNDTHAEMEAIFDLSRSLGAREHILLPYHALGRGKYLKLGLPYAMDGAKPPSAETMRRFVALGKAKGLDVLIIS